MYIYFHIKLYLKIPLVLLYLVTHCTNILTIRKIFSVSDSDWQIHTYAEEQTQFTTISTSTTYLTPASAIATEQMIFCHHKWRRLRPIYYAAGGSKTPVSVNRILLLLSNQSADERWQLKLMPLVWDWLVLIEKCNQYVCMCTVMHVCIYMYKGFTARAANRI